MLQCGEHHSNKPAYSGFFSLSNSFDGLKEIYLDHHSSNLSSESEPEMWRGNSDNDSDLLRTPSQNSIEFGEASPRVPVPDALQNCTAVSDPLVSEFGFSTHAVDISCKTLDTLIKKLQGVFRIMGKPCISDTERSTFVQAMRDFGRVLTSKGLSRNWTEKIHC